MKPDSIQCEIATKESLPGVRNALDIGSNPLVRCGEFFRLRVTNTSGGPVPFIDGAVGSGGVKRGVIDAEVSDEQGNVVGYGSAMKSTIDFMVTVPEESVNFPAPGTMYWPAGETVVEDLPLSHPTFARRSGGRLEWLPGRYQVRGTFTYYPSPGEMRTVKSAPVWVTITAEHIAEWQAR